MFLVIVLALPLIFADSPSNFLTKGLGDVFYCPITGGADCGTGDNVTVLGNKWLIDNIFLVNISEVLTFNASTVCLANGTGCDNVIIAGAINSTQLDTSELSLSSGDVNRSAVATAVYISVDNAFLHPDIDYSDASSNITFFNPIWDDQIITLWNQPGIDDNPFTGSDLNGVDGLPFRNLTFSNAELIVVDNAFLHPDSDYTITGSLITFLNPIWDSQVITIWR